MRDFLRLHFGDHVSRLPAGGERDLGDIGGVYRWTFQIKDMVNVQAAVSLGMRQLGVQQANTGTPHGALIVKRHGTTDPSRQLLIMELGPAVPVIRATQRGDPQ